MGSDASSDRTFEALLSEYKVMQNAILADAKFVDRYVGLYLTAFAVVMAWLLRPGVSTTPGELMQRVEDDAGLTAILLLIPIVNSLVVGNTLRLIAGVVARAHYMTFSLVPQLSELAGSELFLWERSTLSVETSESRWFVPGRSVAWIRESETYVKPKNWWHLMEGALVVTFVAFVTLVSAAILALLFNAAWSTWLMLLWIVAAIATAVPLGGAGLVTLAWSRLLSSGQQQATPPVRPTE